MVVTLVTLSELSSQPSQLINLAVRSSGAEQGGKEASKMIAETEMASLVSGDLVFRSD